MIAIHNSSNGFHPCWIKYCQERKIPYKLVNSLSSNLINELEDCDAFMWHHSQNDPSHLLIAKQILFSIQQSNKKVFPDFNTSWHFDDKVGQKFLLEAVNAPLVPSYVFFNKIEALEWAKKAKFPKVFKLRNGAGSSNVKLVKDKSTAFKYIRKAFKKGFNSFDSIGNLKEVYRKLKQGKASILDILKAFIRLFILPTFVKVHGKEFGYVYFQDFIPNNQFDIRVVAIGDKAFAIKRMVRYNDFRASGSGNIKYEKSNFSDDVIRLGFSIHRALKSQCTAMDFVYDKENPKIVEISYGFVKEVYEPCTGYWDQDLNWYEGKFNPYGWMVDELLINEKK